MTASVVRSSVRWVDDFDTPITIPDELAWTGVEVTIDSTAVPFARATIRTPDTVGPLQFGRRVDVVLKRSWHASEPVAALSATYATVGTVSADAPTVAYLTAAFGAALSDPERLPARRVLHLAPVSISRSTTTGETVLVAASGEQLMLDYRLRRTAAITSGPSVRDAVRLALGMAVGTTSLVVHGAVGYTVVSDDARAWAPGVSAWEFVTSITASAGLRLWCDEVGTWHLATAQTINNGTQTIETDPDPMTYSETRDVTDEQGGVDTGYADAVVVGYRWTAADGTTRHQWDVAGDNAVGTRVLYFELDRPYPGPGEAAARLVKAQRRYSTATVEAVIDPSVYVDRDTTLNVNTGRTGRAESVTWRVPEDVMTINLTEVG